MGAGYSMQCPRCQFQKNFFIGIGLGYHYTRKKLREDALNGKYGKKWKALLEKDVDAKLSASRCLYYCFDCDNAVSDYNLSIVKYKNGKQIKNKKYKHICPKCKSRMYEIKIDENTLLPCPQCGTEVRLIQDMVWD